MEEFQVGTIKMATGSGKSYVIVEDINNSNYKKTLIVFPLLDILHGFYKDYYNELSKYAVIHRDCTDHSVGELLTTKNNIILTTYSSLENYKDQEFDCVFYDECHRLKPKLDIDATIKSESKYLFSATPEKIDKYPVIYEYSYEEQLKKIGIVIKNRKIKTIPKYSCVCGSIIKGGTSKINRHEKTKKHKKFMETQQSNQN